MVDGYQRERLRGNRRRGRRLRPASGSGGGGGGGGERGCHRWGGGTASRGSRQGKAFLNAPRAGGVGGAGEEGIYIYICIYIFWTSALKSWSGRAIECFRSLVSGDGDG